MQCGAGWRGLRVGGERCRVSPWGESGRARRKARADCMACRGKCQGKNPCSACPEGAYPLGS